MELKNKKTGDIWEFDGGFSMKASQETAERAGAMSGSLTCYANSLAELNEEWCDYEQPKDYWYICTSGVIDYDRDENTSYDKHCKEIGNYFETKEEAEQAVEKLKAWKRLKDKGFRFTYWDLSCRGLEFTIDEEKFLKASGLISVETRADLDLLFGGEE